MRPLPTTLLATLAILACAAPRPVARQSPAPAPTTKRFSFSILEDYDKGEPLADVARDFALFRELGVTTWRGSLGWDDYEPARGRYDFVWLHRFAELAARHGIRLRPYLGYTPAWAGVGRTADGAVWNDPPARPDEWTAFVRAIAGAMRRHPNLLSFEIYNEENTRMWWDGSAGEYNRTLRRAADAVRAAAPGVQVLLGGMVWPDADWLEATCATHGNAARMDVIPFHAYPETWTADTVTVETYLGPSFRTDFLPLAREQCGAQPVWINETGYATAGGHTERDQAEWWVRAIATFAAEPAVEHVGIYEIKDARPAGPVIGEPENYHLGLTRADRRPKLAFRTVKLMVRLLAADALTVNDDELGVAVTAGRAGHLYHHLFRRPDGTQVLVVWDKAESPTLRVTLPGAGARVTEYALDGTPVPYGAFDGRRLSDVRLLPGRVRVFEISPS